MRSGAEKAAAPAAKSKIPVPRRTMREEPESRHSTFCDGSQTVSVRKENRKSSGERNDTNARNERNPERRVKEKTNTDIVVDC